MKKIATIALVFAFFACKPSTNQNAEAKCCSNHKEAFDEFSMAVMVKDVNRLKKLTHDSLATHSTFDSLFAQSQNPSVEFVAEESDGAYGIKNIGKTSMYSTKILDNGIKKGIYGIMFEKKGDCFKIVNIVPIISSPKIANSQKSNNSNKNIPSDVPKSQSIVVKPKSRPQTIIVRPSVKDTTFYQGEQGGCYFLNNAGNKVYVEKERCGTFTPKKPKNIVKKVVKQPETVVIPRKSKVTVKKIQPENTEVRTYITGKRGGCYYITSKGNKVYVDRSLCK
jgi:hypothetical protein